MTRIDTLLLRLHIETACRRGGALALFPEDLDATRRLIFLREGRNRAVATALTDPMNTHLQQHAKVRHAPRIGHGIDHHRIASCREPGPRGSEGATWRRT
jgi:hypothetical protein